MGKIILVILCVFMTHWCLAEEGTPADKATSYCKSQYGGIRDPLGRVQCLKGAHVALGFASANAPITLLDSCKDTVWNSTTDSYEKTPKGDLVMIINIACADGLGYALTLIKK